jgi:ATP-dependent RNA helicase RhlE
MSFSSLGLSAPILTAIDELGYTKPSPIQAQAIPAVLKGRDIMAAAQTGTGKTAGFTLPLLEILSKGERARNNQIRALVLTPTRELAAQVYGNVSEYGQHLALRSSVVFGGVKINPQMMKLRQGADILVATPGRLLDLYNQNAINFKRLEILVLDEADRMLDMGFIHDIKRILKVLPPQRQNLLFSATFSDEIRALAKGLVSNPVEISVTPPNSTVKTVKQWVIPVDKKKKPAALLKLIVDNDWQQALVFSRTKHGANRLATFLEKSGLSVAAIHGNKSQGARIKALANFREGKIKILVATDIAARGLDIDQLPHVVNLDLPNVPADYVHRIGRTGRAGAKGEALSLVSVDEGKELSDIENLIQKHIPRQYLDGFDPVNEVPITRISEKKRPPKKPKKPKQPKQHRDGQHSDKPAKKSHHSGNKNTRRRSGGKATSRTKKPSRNR